MSKSREHQSLNKMFRTGLHLEFQVDTYYGLNPTPQSPIGSVCVDVKGETSHATLNMMIKIKRLQLSHIVCINMTSPKLLSSLSRLLRGCEAPPPSENS